jgi:hypothetical protein
MVQQKISSTKIDIICVACRSRSMMLNRGRTKSGCGSQTAPKAHQPGFDHRRSRPRCPALELIQALSFPSPALVEAHFLSVLNSLTRNR